MQAIQSWIEQSPYAAALGVKCESVGDAAVSLFLPFSERNANPGGALHGGCAASLGVIAGHAIARTALGEEAAPFHTAGLQVNYLAAAIGEEVVARGTLLRCGKNMCFVEVDISTREGKSIAHATSMLRARFGASPAELALTTGEDGNADPGSMGPQVAKLNFAKARGFEVQNMAEGRSRIVMPSCASNSDASGAMHEGAIVALVDMTGAMAAWAEAGPGPYKASTPALQAQILAPPTEQDLVAYGRVVQRDSDGFWSDVEVAGREDGRVIARGTVLYRIVT
jgi:uncharacterized protein (TIGR00369 family)